MTSITQVLRTILLEGMARTQSEIQQALELQGFSSSQSTISRLLHQIGAVKIVDTQGKTQYRLPNESGLMHEMMSPQDKFLVRQWVLSMVSNETLIIIHTTPGAAGMVARLIDQQRARLGVLGTLAGDDSIFVAPKTQQTLAETSHAIAQLLDL